MQPTGRDPEGEMKEATILQDSGSTKIDRANLSVTQTHKYLGAGGRTQSAIRGELGSWSDDH